MEKRSMTEDDKFLNALAQAFRLQEAILNATELAIFSVSPEGVITSFNKSAENLLGYRAEDLIGKANPLIFHDLDQIIKRSQDLSEQLGQTIEPVFDVFTIIAKTRDITDRNEWTFIQKDGKRFPGLLSISTLVDE